MSHKKKSKLKKIDFSLSQLLISFIIATVIISTIFLFFFKLTIVNNNGMSPTLKKNNVVLVKKEIDPIKRFDIVTCNIGGRSFILRVIGLPEESIVYEKNTLYIDGESIDEKFIIDEINQYAKKGEEYTNSFTMNLFGDINSIPSDCYLLLGDERQYGNDSRYFGLINKTEIESIVIAKVFPFKEYKLF